MDVVVLSTADSVSLPNSIIRDRRAHSDDTERIQLSFAGRAFETKDEHVAVRPNDAPDAEIHDAEIVEVAGV